MTLSPIEVIATLFAALGLVKLVVIFVNKDKWWQVTKNVYENPQIFSWVFLLLAGLVFYFLMQELNIIQVVAVAGFVTLLMGISLLGNPKEVLEIAKKIYKKGFSSWQWAYFVIWLFILLWVLFEVYIT